MLRSLLAWLRFIAAHFRRCSTARDNRDHVVQLERQYRVAVENLPTQQRQVFLLHRVDDLSISDIAERLDISTREVERLLSGALHEISVHLTNLADY